MTYVRGAEETAVHPGRMVTSDVVMVEKSRDLSRR